MQAWARIWTWNDREQIQQVVRVGLEPVIAWLRVRRARWPLVHGASNLLPQEILPRGSFCAMLCSFFEPFWSKLSSYSFPIQGIKVFAGRCVVAVVIIHVPRFPSTTTERTRLQARQALVAALKQVLYPDLHHQHLQLNRPPPPQHHPAFPHRLLLPHRLLPQPLARELQVWISHPLSSSSSDTIW